MPRSDVSHFLRICQACCRNFEIHFRKCLAVLEASGCPETPSALLCGKTGVGGDPSDRAAALPEFRYCPLPRACNTWSENTYKIHAKPL